MKRVKDRLVEFIFDQHCMPWSLRLLFYEIRNTIFNINSKKHWDGIWKIEKKCPRKDRYYPNAFAMINYLVPAGSSVIDIGCGVGILLEQLKAQKNCQVFGVDISEEAIKAIKEKGMDGFVSNVPPIPLPSNCYDVAIASELLEHVNKPLSVLKEMARLVKQGGIIIVTVPDVALTPLSEREHLRSYDENKLRRLFARTCVVKHMDIFRVKEKEESFFRLIAKGYK